MAMKVRCCASTCPSTGTPYRGTSGGGASRLHRLRRRRSAHREGAAQALQRVAAGRNREGSPRRLQHPTAGVRRRAAHRRQGPGGGFHQYHHHRHLELGLGHHPASAEGP